MFSNKNLYDIKNLINTKNKIIILTHYNPDGDAIGSSLALQNILNQLGKISKVIVPNEFPKFLKWLPESKEIIIAEYKEKYVQSIINNAELIFCLDFNNADRLGNLGKSLKNSTAIKILIDHHEQPEVFDYVYSDINEPATCQMIYRFILALEEEKLINKEVATCLYSGILTDTGSFRFRNTTADTHRIVAALIEKGAEPDIISSNILDNNTINRFKLLSLAFESLEVIQDKNTSIMHLTRKDMLNLGYQKGDTEGFVNYGLSINGIVFTIFLTEDILKNIIKISFRSKGNFDVNQFARQYFDGGGHINASGGRSELSMDETIKRLKNIISTLDINEKNHN